MDVNVTKLNTSIYVSKYFFFFHLRNGLKRIPVIKTFIIAISQLILYLSINSYLKENRQACTRIADNTSYLE